jgi:hypothetical protein
MECRCEAERAGADGPAPARGVQVERKQGCRACRGRARETAQRARPAGSVKGAVRGAAGVPRSHRRHSRRCAHTERGTPRLSLVEWFGRAELRWREEAKWWAEARAACGAAIRVGRCRPAGVPSGRRLSCSQAIGCLAAACAMPVAQRRRREGAQAGGNSTSPAVPRACRVCAAAVPARCRSRLLLTPCRADAPHAASRAARSAVPSCSLRRYAVPRSGHVTPSAAGRPAAPRDARTPAPHTSSPGKDSFMLVGRDGPGVR